MHLVEKLRVIGVLQVLTKCCFRKHHYLILEFFLISIFLPNHIGYLLNLNLFFIFPFFWDDELRQMCFGKQHSGKPHSRKTCSAMIGSDVP